MNSVARVNIHVITNGVKSCLYENMFYEISESENEILSENICDAKIYIQRNDTNNLTTF